MKLNVWGILTLQQSNWFLVIFYLLSASSPTSPVHTRRGTWIQAYICVHKRSHTHTGLQFIIHAYLFKRIDEKISLKHRALLWIVSGTIDINQLPRCESIRINKSGWRHSATIYDCTMEPFLLLLLFWTLIIIFSSVLHICIHWSSLFWLHTTTPSYYAWIKSTHWKERNYYVDLIENITNLHI